VSRFSQAISEGDGISVIPALEGGIGTLAPAAAAAGAEAISVATVAEVEHARDAVAVPVLVRESVSALDAVERVRAAGADAFVVDFEQLAHAGESLEELYAEALELDVDCVLAVRDEDELARALERVDPDIVLVARQDRGDEEELERTLDLLADVPAGKLVIAESGLVARAQVLALERAGVDAIIVQGLGGDPGFSHAVEQLAGGRRPLG
jgi:indole-3-glycerol phosphate synthase